MNKFKNKSKLLSKNKIDRSIDFFVESNNKTKEYEGRCFEMLSNIELLKEIDIDIDLFSNKNIHLTEEYCSLMY